MASTKRLAKSFFRLLLPIFILLPVALIGASIWLVQNSVIPPTATYLMTPEKYGLLSTRGAKVTDEKWNNKDGSQARGWLLRGAEGKPAIILLHRFGADRSWLLNLGVKLNEITDATVLMPDLRGHGETPLVKTSGLSGYEADDTLSALEYLKTLKTENNTVLVGNSFGIYGVELGALAGLSASAKEPNVKAIAIDSIPLDSDDLLANIISRKYPFASSVTAKIAQLGTYPYFYSGGYSREKMCEVAKMVSNRKVIALSGNDIPQMQNSATKVAECFTNPANIEKKLDLMPSGFNIINASIEQSEIYDQRVIDFFKKSLFTTNE